MNCIPFGFWFEAGRALFGLSIMGAICVVFAVCIGIFVWKTR